jgi:hypothetical protein
MFLCYPIQQDGYVCFRRTCFVRVLFFDTFLGDHMMNFDWEEVTGRKVWHLCMGVLFLVGLVISGIAAKYHTFPVLGLSLMGGSVLGVVASWLHGRSATPKVQGGRIVSQRTSVAKGDTIAPTERGRNLSDFTIAEDYWSTPQPATAGAPAQSMAAQQPTAGTGEWFNLNKELVMQIILILLGVAFEVAAIVCGFKAAHAEVALGYVISMFLCFLTGIMLIAAATDSLKGLGTWAKENPALVWLIFSVVAAICFGVSAYEGAYVWHWDNWEWAHIAFALAVISVVVTALYMADLLKPIAAWVGGIIWAGFNFTKSFTLSTLLWLMTITGVCLFVALTMRSPVFDRLLYADVAGEVFAIGNLTVAFGVGFFLLMAAAVADYYRFKK